MRRLPLILLLLAPSAASAAGLSHEGAAGMGNLNVNITIRPPNISGSAPSSGGGSRPERYERSEFDSSARARSEGPDPLVEAIGALIKGVFELADAATKPLRDAIKQAIENRRRNREERERLEGILEDWKRQQVQEDHEIAIALSTGVAAWRNLRHPRQEVAVAVAEAEGETNYVNVHVQRNKERGKKVVIEDEGWDVDRAGGIAVGEASRVKAKVHPELFRLPRLEGAYRGTIEKLRTHRQPKGFFIPPSKHLDPDKKYRLDLEIRDCYPIGGCR